MNWYVTLVAVIAGFNWRIELLSKGTNEEKPILKWILGFVSRICICLCVIGPIVSLYHIRFETWHDFLDKGIPWICGSWMILNWIVSVIEDKMVYKVQQTTVCDGMDEVSEELEDNRLSSETGAIAGVLVLVAYFITPFLSWVFYLLGLLFWDMIYSIDLNNIHWLLPLG